MAIAMVAKAMAMAIVTKVKVMEQQMAAMMAKAMTAKAMAMAMVTKGKVRVDQMVAMMASRESEVAGVAACPLGDDWEIPDTRQGPTLF